MSFGWSAGDILAGLRLVWDVWNSVRDGPLNAAYEATQFFDDFEIIKGCLESWDSQDPASSGKPSLTEPLRRQCAKFIQEHISLIQDVNNDAIITQDVGRVWLRKVPFTKQQVLRLYQQVQWPFVRGDIAKLRSSLELALGVATYRVAENTHELVRKLSISIEEIRQARLESPPTPHEIPNPHHRLAYVVTCNLNRIINPLESDQRVNGIDYPFLLQFGRELHLPEPFSNSQAVGSRDSQSPSLQTAHGKYFDTQVSDAIDKRFSRSTTFNESTQLYDNSLIWRLDNLSMRVAQTTNATLPSQETIDSTIQTLIKHLRVLRRDIFGLVELADRLPQPNDFSGVNYDSRNALVLELTAWKKLKLDDRTLADRANSNHFSPQRNPMSSRRSPKLGDSRFSSPSSSYGPWSSYAFPPGLATAHEDIPLDVPPEIRVKGNPPQSFRHVCRISSVSSISLEDQQRISESSLLPFSHILDSPIPIQLDYNSQINLVPATVQSISKTNKGSPQSVWICSKDGQTRFQHSLDPKLSEEIETTLKPFLENRGIATEHKFRIQFMGVHKLTMINTNSQAQTVLDISRPPIYIFGNENDFLAFQKLLLNKEVKCYPHIKRIEAIPKDNTPESHNSGTIRILLEPTNKVRSILYFRTRPDPNKAFVEWSVDIFKRPDKPKSKSASLTLKSKSDMTLQVAQIQWKQEQRANAPKDSLLTGSRRAASFSSTSSKGSTASLPSTAPRKQSAKHEEKLIKGLVIEFCDPKDCLAFWNEFTA